ncbi:MAG TPA: TIR domain-containing protein [Rhizomicrobium sp.]|jgi:hypothetical protein|nr:TIR domain-containing protein [Rhizomicrobium sp.]
MGRDVFISYSSKDRRAAEAACAVLEAKGISCWIAPRDIAPGANWAATIADTIAQARVLLLIFSSNANASEQVQREVDVAANHRLSIIPLRIENALPEKSLEYFLNQRHWLDAYTPPLEQHLNRLADAIGLLLSDASAPIADLMPPPARNAPAAPPAESGRSFGPYLLGAAVLVSIALVAFGWVAFRREAMAPPAAPPVVAATTPAPNLMAAPVPPDAPRTVIYARAAQCTLTANGTNYCVTSALASQHDAVGQLNAYGPQNLFDGNPATAWCEGVAGPGDGQEIVLEFSAPTVVGAITVVNGYAKSDATFANNNSVHTLTAIWPDGTTSALELADSKASQTVSTGRDALVKRVRFRIDSVNGGSKWPDSCISELRVVTR